MGLQNLLRNAVIVGLIQIKTPFGSGEGEPEPNGANGRRRKA